MPRAFAAFGLRSPGVVQHFESPAPPCHFSVWGHLELLKTENGRKVTVSQITAFHTALVRERSGKCVSREEQAPFSEVMGRVGLLLGGALNTPMLVDVCWAPRPVLGTSVMFPPLGTSGLPCLEFAFIFWCHFYWGEGINVVTLGLAGPAQGGDLIF